MTTKYLLLLVAALILCFFSMSAVGSIGVATYYGPPYTPSACHGRLNEGVMVAAASRALYGGRAICGKKYRVRCLSAAYRTNTNPCKNNEVVVSMVDYCPGCQGSHIDLSRAAFASIAHLSAGRIKIDFQQI